MKLYYLPVVLILFFSFHTAFADCAVTSILRTGSKGVEVQCLQSKIGAIADGNFGPLTKASVVAFQSNNGLAADGVVGPLSRSVLNSIAITGDVYPSGCVSSVGYSTSTGIKCDSTSNPATSNSSTTSSNSTATNNSQTQQSPGVVTNTNPNLINLDKFISAVVEVNRKYGKSEQQLATIADALRKKLTDSNIDYNEKFKEQLESDAKKLSANITSPGMFNRIISGALSFLGITPKVAQASAGLPFGGALLSSIFCDESANYMIFMQPLPPTFVVTLSYTLGTQGFAGYNIPFTRYLLGTYIIPGICVIGAGPATIEITTEGTILPMTGSSLL